MAHIHWYPGHIAKAERKLKEQLSLVDVIIEIIDARLPLSSRYRGIETLIGEKPRFIVMNKADLADGELLPAWKKLVEKEYNLPVVLTSASSPKDLSSIVSVAVEQGKGAIEKLAAKGILPRPIRAMIIGMPNVGKSSIINKLIKKSKVKVGSKAGVTRTSQWVRVNPKLELLDTPGIIPLKLEDQVAATKLAMVNSVSENAYDYMEIAQDLIKLIHELYPNVLNIHYKLETDIEPTLENIAEARSWILTAGRLDTNRCASFVLSDFRHGRLGRFVLDSFPNE